MVPTRNLTPIDASDAMHAFKADLESLGLRVEAGERRDRGGHDLRGWYKTRCIEDGADSLIIRRTTHAPPRDVNAGYERFTWATLCREWRSSAGASSAGRYCRLLPVFLPPS